jgi:hypothetical protein
MRKDRATELVVGGSTNRRVGERGNFKGGETTLSAVYCCVKVLCVTVAARYNKSVGRI